MTFFLTIFSKFSELSTYCSLNLNTFFFLKHYMVVFNVHFGKKVWRVFLGYTLAWEEISFGVLDVAVLVLSQMPSPTALGVTWDKSVQKSCISNLATLW